MVEKMNDGKAAGGHARAKSLTAEERSEQSSNAVKARWEKEKLMQILPKVILKKDDLRLGDTVIPCAIIEDGEGNICRILTESGITTAVLGERSGYAKRTKKKQTDEGGSPLPMFLSPERLRPYLTDDLMNGPLLRPIEYVDGNRIVTGYDARILPVVCEVWLKAREAGVLQAQQRDKALKAEVLMRALAHIGIIALVDEATGYQYVRARNDLARILEAFVAKELRPWVKRFDADFYQQIFRLRGLEFPTGTVKRPQYFGHITNDIIYRRLAPGVWKELKEKVEKDEKGRAKHKLHQHLTMDIGDPRLNALIASVTTIMKLSSNWQDFMGKLDQIHPAYNATMTLPLEIKGDTGEGL